jgi:hypothetical protein
MRGSLGTLGEFHQQLPGSTAVVGVAPTTRHAFQFPIFHLSKRLLVTTPQVFGRLYFLKKQSGHAEFISASHQYGYPLYRQLIAKHVFYFASEMPICIGMTPHFISSEHLHQQRRGVG